jgi:hypothetical protein
LQKIKEKEIPTGTNHGVDLSTLMLDGTGSLVRQCVRCGAARNRHKFQNYLCRWLNILAASSSSNGGKNELLPMAETC